MMKRTCAALICMALPWQAQASFFDYVDLELTSAPTLHVSGDAQGWSKASTDALTVQAQAKGRCSWGHRVTFVGTTLNRRTDGHGVLLDSERLVDEPKNKDQTWSSNWKPLSLGWAPDVNLREAAVKACQGELAERMKMGQSRLSILNKGLVTSIAGPSFGLHMSCDDYGLVGQKRDLYRNAQVKVQCDALDLPAPEPVVNPAANLAAPQVLSQVMVESNPSNHVGTCPVKLTFRGRIYHNPSGGSVEYRFLFDGQPLGAFKMQALQSGASQTLVEQGHTVAEQAGGMPTMNKMMPAVPQGMLPQPQLAPSSRVRLEVRQGGRAMSAEAPVSVQCTPKPGRQPMPGQGDLPDLTSVQGMQIGQQHASWGGQMVLSEADASHISPHGCTWRFAYDVLNQSTVAASPSIARLTAMGAGTLHQASLTRGPMAQSPVSGALTLPPGQHILLVSLDDGKTVPESSEGNNMFRMSVTVPQACSGESQPARRAMRR